MPGGVALPEDAEGVGADGAHSVLGGGNSGRPGGAGPAAPTSHPSCAAWVVHGGQERMDGGGVLQVAEQLAGLSAGDVGPVEGFAGEQGNGAPAAPWTCSPRCGRGGPAWSVPGRSGPAARSPLRAGLREVQGLQEAVTTWEARWGETPISPARSPNGNPGPVADEVDGPSSRRAGGRRAAGSRERASAVRRRPGRRAWKPAAAPPPPEVTPPGSRSFQGLAQTHGGVHRLGTPHRVAEFAPDTTSPSTARNTGDREAVQHPAGVPAAAPGRASGPAPPRAAAPGAASTCAWRRGSGRRCGPDARCPRCVRRAVPKGRVQGRGPEPAEAEMGRARPDRTAASRYTAATASRRSRRMRPPAVRDGTGAEQFLHGNALVSGQPFQPSGGEVKPLGGGKEGGGVGHGVAESVLDPGRPQPRGPRPGTGR